MVFANASLIFLLDQFSKFLVRNNLSSGQSIPIIPHILYLTLVYNRGAAFGIFKGQVVLFILTSLASIILIYLHLSRNKQRVPFLRRFSLSLILSGALGNLTDRVVFGYVIDFIDLRIWPVFNIADTSITVGAILLAYTILRTKPAG